MRLPSAAQIEHDALTSAAVAAGVERVARDVEDEAHQIAARRAYNEGTYRSRIMRRRGEQAHSELIVATDRKSRWIEEGTGVWGPRRTPIRPKKGKFLVFELTEPGSAPIDHPRRQPALVFAKQVKGRPASWVMRDAAENVARRLGARMRNLRTFRG